MSHDSQLVDFNSAKDSYGESIEKAIAFAGASHDYYTKAKADALKRVVARHFPQLQKPTLLDVGCGHGLIHPYLTNSFNITGADVAGEVLALAKKKNPAVTYVAYDNLKLPFADASFDLALAICVMHHVPPADWVPFLAEMKRVVRPGGAVFIGEHNPLNPLTRYVVAHNHIDVGVTLLSSSRLRTLMDKAGLGSARTENVLFTPFSQRFFVWLDRALKWCPLGAQYFTFARK